MSGCALASAWNQISDCQNAELAEGIACLEGIKFVRAFNNRPLIVESDCQCFISAVLDVGVPRSLLRPIIQDIK